MKWLKRLLKRDNAQTRVTPPDPAVVARLAKEAMSVDNVHPTQYEIAEMIAARVAIAIRDGAFNVLSDGIAISLTLDVQWRAIWQPINDVKRAISPFGLAVKKLVVFPMFREDRTGVNIIVVPIPDPPEPPPAEHPPSNMLGLIP